MHGLKDRPPKLGEWLLKRFLLADECHEKLGDFEEGYHIKAGGKGKRRALVWYWLQLILTIPVFVKNLAYWKLIMFKNYLKIALRNIVRQKPYSFVNILGLAVGMACCILIYVYVNYELSYDSYHPDVDSIYRTTMHFKIADADFFGAKAPGPMAAALRRDYPEVSKAFQVIVNNRILIEAEGNYFEESRLLYVEDDFFNIWSIDFSKGGAQEITGRPYTILLTESMARKYFGSADPIGEIIQLNRHNYEITGIIKDPPSNTHLKYNFLASICSFREKPEEMTEWSDCFGEVYVKLNPGVKGEDFREKIRWIAHQHSGEYFKQRGWTYETVLEPIRSLHLHSRADAGNSMLMIYGISVIGFLILLIACLNFINLTSATASARAKEVGVRKVTGAQQAHLIQQFIGESLSLTFIALLISILIAIPALPYFNQLIEREFSLDCFLQPTVLLFMLLIILAIGTLAGSYPAFILSKLKLASIVANRFAPSGHKSTLRRIFIIVQFAVTTFFIISTFTVFNQIGYMKNQNLGFEKKQKLIVPVNFKNNFDIIKNEFLQHPNILGVTASSHFPDDSYNSITSRLYGEETKEIVLNYFYFDPDFIFEYKIPMAVGRNFDKNLSTDLGRALILNESAIKIMGWDSPPEAIGKTIESGGHGEEYNKTIIGVTKDFHYQGLQKQIEPLGMVYQPDYFGVLNLSVKTENLPETLAFVKNKWSELHLGEVFSYNFLDESFNRLYAAEEKTSKIFTTLAVLAVFLSCLGLFGLSSLVAVQRTKEIGIRKILGATVPKILAMISGEFVWLVFAANLLAWPISYYVMKTWLGNFAYRIELTWPIFALAAFIGLLVALVTVSYQSLKAALANPADSLRYE